MRVRYFLAVIGLLGLLSQNCSGTSLDPKVVEALKIIPEDLRLSYVVNHTNSTCNGLWKSNGLVCNPGGLVELSNAEKNKIGELEESINLSASLLSQYSNQILSKKAPLPADSTAFFTKWANQTYLKYFQQETSKCWKYMAFARSSSLCYMCSGNNYRYFLEGKAIITEDACNTMLDNCAVHFQESINIIEGTRIGIDLLAQRKEKASQSQNSSLAMFNKTAGLIISTANQVLHNDIVNEELKKIESNLAIYLNKSTSETDKAAAAKDLCFIFFRLRKVVFLGPASDVLLITVPLIYFHAADVTNPIILAFSIMNCLKSIKKNNKPIAYAVPTMFKFSNTFSLFGGRLNQNKSTTNTTNFTSTTNVFGRQLLSPLSRQITSTNRYLFLGSNSEVAGINEIGSQVLQLTDPTKASEIFSSDVTFMKAGISNLSTSANPLNNAPMDLRVPFP